MRKVNVFLQHTTQSIFGMSLLLVWFFKFNILFCFFSFPLSISFFSFISLFTVERDAEMGALRDCSAGIGELGSRLDCSGEMAGLHGRRRAAEARHGIGVAAALSFAAGLD
ncbi:hypothetical protein M0R45_005927 [Rubus argutus]|uniref:Uncharacterized protein n=1 Tax=Rubus argutus TaxID=59490 RepID=A0AAW1YP49_RUBAR